MKKKILLGLAAVVVVAGGVAALSAFEAHVINVTATIENALTVPTTAIEFGTVFPQEKLDSQLTVGLSRSFLNEDRVDDVEYIIRQKPKPKPDIDPEPGLKPDVNMYMLNGNLYPALYPYLIDNMAKRAEYCYVREPANADDPNDLYYLNCYPVLCPYISKHPDTDVPNDGSLDAFHEMGIDVKGRLAKSELDEVDNWTIDLDVPCFEGQCAQDWTHQGWELPANLESAVFGCDLWVEVTGVSRPID